MSIAPATPLFDHGVGSQGRDVPWPATCADPRVAYQIPQKPHPTIRNKTRNAVRILGWLTACVGVDTGTSAAGEKRAGIGLNSEWQPSSHRGRAAGAMFGTPGTEWKWE